MRNENRTDKIGDSKRNKRRVRWVVLFIVVCLAVVSYIGLAWKENGNEIFGIEPARYSDHCDIPIVGVGGPSEIASLFESNVSLVIVRVDFEDTTNGEQSVVATPIKQLSGKSITGPINVRGSFWVDKCDSEGVGVASLAMREGGVYILPLIESDESYASLGQFSYLIEIDDQGKLNTHADSNYEISRLDGISIDVFLELFDYLNSEQVYLDNLQISKFLGEYHLIKIDDYKLMDMEPVNHSFSNYFYDIKVEDSLGLENIGEELTIHVYSREIPQFEPYAIRKVDASIPSSLGYDELFSPISRLMLYREMMIVMGDDGEEAFIDDAGVDTTITAIQKILIHSDKIINASK